MVSVGSKKKVWWKCSECGYEWQAAIYNRTKDKPSGCPKCSGRIGTKLPPNLISEWHPEKNKGLLATQVTAGSSRRVWWKCKEGHEWQMTIICRVNGSNCPFCEGKMLSTANPELAKEWHPALNGNLKPESIYAHSKQRVWWLGKCGHEWQATVSDRYCKKADCPFCSGNRILVGYNDLQSVNPELASEWHPTKNGDNKPSQYTQASTYKAWWLGKCGHEWIAQVASRSAGAGCPICAKRQQTSFPEQTLFFYLLKVCPDAVNGYKDIFNNRMELDIYLPSIQAGIEYDGVAWHSTKGSAEREKLKYAICKENGITLIRVKEGAKEQDGVFADYSILVKKSPSFLDLDELIKNTFDILGLDLPKSGVNTEKDNDDIRAQYLSKLKVNSLASRNPLLAKEWHPTKNGVFTPDMFYPHSQDVVWWLGECGHEWTASISSRSSGYNCPYCSGKRILEGFNDLNTVSPILASEWHPTKNGALSPKDISSGSGKKVWWLGKCGHEWQARVSDRLFHKSGCPYCQRKKLLRGFNDLESLNPTLAIEWHPTKNAPLSPRDVTSNVNKKVWWLSSCGHEWQASVSSRNSGDGCPYCSGKRVLQGFNDLESQCPDILEDWDYEKNNILPSMLTKRSGKKVFWKCRKCGREWLASPHDKKPCQCINK